MIGQELSSQKSLVQDVWLGQVNSFFVWLACLGRPRLLRFIRFGQASSGYGRLIQVSSC